ncbi:MAG: hypothetical protein AAFY60_18625 [Myxococcota bacterium]
MTHLDFDSETADDVYSSEDCQIRRRMLHPRLVQFVATGRLSADAVEWCGRYLSEISETLAPAKPYVAWDSSVLQGYTSEARKRATQWFFDGGSRKLRRFILLLPKNPLIKMGTNVALTLITSSVMSKKLDGLRLTTDPAQFKELTQEALNHLRTR